MSTQKELDEFREDIKEVGSAPFSIKDNINPSHYSRMAIEPNTFISENNLEWEVGNIVKYISRYKNKNGLEDLRKAKKYLELLADRVYKEDL